MFNSRQFLTFLILPTLMLATVSGLSTDLKGKLCTGLNLTAGECLDYWTVFDSSFNKTVYVNQTIYFNTTVIDSSSEADKERQFQLDKMRLELEFAGFNRTVNPPVTSKVYTQEELDLKLSEEIAKRVPQQVSNNSKSIPTYYYLIAGVLALGGFWYWRKQSNVSLPMLEQSVVYPQSDSYRGVVDDKPKV